LRSFLDRVMTLASASGYFDPMSSLSSLRKAAEDVDLQDWKQLEKCCVAEGPWPKLVRTRGSKAPRRIAGVAAVWIAPSRLKIALLGCFAGGVAGVVWWLIVQPGAPVAVAVVVGAPLGTLVFLFG
jgi:hypothetical protein